MVVGKYLLLIRCWQNDVIIIILNALFWGEKRLTKCTANGFVGSLLSDIFFGYLYIKKIVPSPFLSRCLKYFGSKFTDSCIPGIKGESLFYTKEFFLSVCKRYFIRIRMFFLLLFFLVSHVRVHSIEFV